MAVMMMMMMKGLSYTSPRHFEYRVVESDLGTRMSPPLPLCFGLENERGREKWDELERVRRHTIANGLVRWLYSHLRLPLPKCPCSEYNP